MQKKILPNKKQSGIIKPERVTVVFNFRRKNVYYIYYT